MSEFKFKIGQLVKYERDGVMAISRVIGISVGIMIVFDPENHPNEKPGYDQPYYHLEGGVNYSLGKYLSEYSE